MKNTHEFKTVHDPLFCEEGDVAHLVNKDGSEFKTNQEEFCYPKDIPACNPNNSCEVIQDFLEDENVKDKPDIPSMDKLIKEFLDEETNELEIIKNQFDIAFKEKSRMTIIRDYANQQLIDAQKDLDAVNATIENLNVAYLNLKTK
jgi:hypothetical protein